MGKEEDEIYNQIADKEVDRRVRETPPSQERVKGSRSFKGCLSSFLGRLLAGQGFDSYASIDWEASKTLQGTLPKPH